MKLEIELVPSSCWRSNMRNAMTKKQWDTLRKSVYEQYNHRCALCNAEGMLHCHEIWHYDDEEHIQTLKGFIALCTMCHHVKHIGHARVLADKGQLDINSVIEHYCKVNECSKKDFDVHEAKALKQLKKRNKHPWLTEFGDYEHLVNTELP
jgi:hypothetical protein